MGRRRNAPQDDQARFWSSVDKSGECWLWTGPVHKTRGGGLTTYDGARSRGHRAAWMFTHGPLAEGARVLHACGNSLCVRLDHLYRARVNAAELLVEFQAGGVTHTALARKYGVDRSHISGLIQQARARVPA